MKGPLPLSFKHEEKANWKEEGNMSKTDRSDPENPRAGWRRSDHRCARRRPDFWPHCRGSGKLFFLINFVYNVVIFSLAIQYMI